ncbi:MULTISPECIES: MBL fold metallo-hydrolase [Halomicrobium]|uniref:Beta-lactamase domain protein n=2 Tax=Halomicrobium mukohataei TaxID=57705 RepID=C7NWM2_HALMD|nr:MULTISPECIES: MBL fold metallo-hydrolase [Halomicrobium]ACV48232.1 beta-lactamase domain protein [Halomicrobium mukohataei DSM 12286]QCD66653.1 MBL fold metallo-hydrolase [Halomicrobium mukohataei]QFR21459.1 MBL fold metallo-hydrolase [Halomicrobium sp. ZPS1]
MRLTFLGTGSAMPTGTRFQSGLLLEDGSDRLLVDCGSGVLHALERTDVGYEGVDTVLLTHHHLDHVSDLDVFMKARWLAGDTDLTIAGPPGTRDLIEGLLDLHGYMRGRLDLTIDEVGVDEPFTLAGFDIEAMETRHSMQCFAYRFQAGGEEPALVYSGDSEAFTELIEFADRAAVLVHDCSFPDEVDVSNHPTPAQLGTVLDRAEAAVGRVYLTHLYPHTEGRHEEMLDSIAASYDGDVRFAADGLSVTIDPTES